MDKNKIAFTIVKTTLIVTIAFCLLFSLFGLVNLYSFKQMVETEIRLSGFGLIVSPRLTNEFAAVSSKTITMAFLVFFLILFNIFHLTKFLIKSEKTVKSVNIAVSAICIAAQIAAMVLCIIVMKQSFDLIDILSSFNNAYPDAKNYYDYVYLQSYQNSALSTFTPFIVASILSVLINIANIIFNSRKSDSFCPAEGGTK